MKEEKETPKTYYEKILVSSGEVPEQDKLKGEYVFIQKDGSITSLIFPCWMPEGFYEEHFESWLKPVPSPKQEALDKPFIVLYAEIRRRFRSFDDMTEPLRSIMLKCSKIVEQLEKGESK